MQDLYTKILKSKRFQKFGIPFLVFILVSLGFFASQLFSGQVEASWWDDNWIYRNSFSVTKTVSQQSDVFIEFELDSSDIITQNDCGDFRFTDSSANQLPYYIVSGCGTATTTVHLNFSVLPVDTKTIYFYYGNNTAENGFSNSDFSQEASNYTVGSLGSQEVGTSPSGYWKFENNSGTTVNDVSGQGNDGYMFGSLWRNDDECFLGACIKGASTSDSVKVNHNLNLNTPEITVQAWVKSTSTEENIIEKKATEFGDGSDGSITINSTKNLATDNIAVGRSCSDGGDAVSYSVGALSSSTATLSYYPSSGCLSAGDKVMLINLQGTSAAHGNVGNYELLDIASIEHDTVTFSANKTKYYGNATSSDDSNISEQIFEYSSYLSDTVSANSHGNIPSPSFADLDNDGDLDMIIGNQDGTINWFRNTGDSKYPVWTEDSANLATGITSLDVGSYARPDFADLDSDGDLDFITHHDTYGLYGYKNIGSPTNPEWEAWDINDGLYVAAADLDPSLADLDADGDIDLLYGEQDGTLHWYSNSSSSNPSWTEASSTFATGIESLDVGTYSSPDLADIDNDGDYDLVIGRYNGTFSWYENTGGTSSPSWTEASSTLGVGISTLDLADLPQITFADLNDDGYLEFIAGDDSDVLKIYRNVPKPNANTQKVVLQRIPQYIDVSIENAGSLTTSAWDGTMGGVLPFMASGKVYIESGGSVSAIDKGYNLGSNVQGESYGGQGINSASNNYGGGGRYIPDNYYYAGGGYGTAGETINLAVGGEVYGDASLSKIFLGSDGGARKGSGGIIYLKTNNLDIEGDLSSSATFHGSGGSLFVSANSFLTSNDIVKVKSDGGVYSSGCGTKCGYQGAGGDGRIHIKSNNFTGTTSPAAATSSATFDTNPYSLKIENNKAYFSATIGGTEYNIPGTTDINDGEWHLLTGTYDGDNLKIYVDGVLQGENSTPNGDMDISPGPLMINSFFSSAYIDEAKIYPYARDSDQIVLDYNTGVFGVDSNNNIGVSFGNPEVQTHNPTGYWPLDFGSGSVAYDNSIQNNNGAISGSGWETGVSCLLGDCLSMDSLSDKIVVPNNPDLNPGSVSLAAWVNTGDSSGDIIAKRGNYYSYDSVERTGSEYHTQSNAGDQASTSSFSVTVPADAEIAVVVAAGRVAGEVAIFDILNWDAGGTNDFTSIVRNSASSYTMSEALYMTASSTDWPGATTTDLTWSTNNLIQLGLNIVVFFYKNVDLSSPILATQSAYPASSWTSSLDIGINDMGVVAAHNRYYNDGKGGGSGPVIADPSGSGQTAIWESVSPYRDSHIGVADKLGDGTLEIDAETGYNYFAPIAFGIKANNNAENTAYYYLGLENGRAKFKIFEDTTAIDGVGTSYVATSTSSVNDSAWHYLVGTYDEQDMKLYVDGTLEATNSDFSGAIESSDGDLNIGTNFSSSTIDEIKIYNYPRVASQIESDYASGLSGTSTSRAITAYFGDDSAFSRYCGPNFDGDCASPVLEVKMDEKSGDTLYNNSSSGVNGILGGDGVGNDLPVWTRAQVGHALDFDGSDDYVDFATSTALDLPGAMTVCSWVYPRSIPNGSDSRVIANSDSSGLNQQYSLEIENNRAVSLYWDSYYIGTPAGAIDFDEWSHICAVRSSTSTGAIYINGLAQDITISGGAIPTSGFGNTVIGRAGDDTASYFDGLIDHLFVYDYARDCSQIAWTYNKGRAILNLELDECEGSFAHNYNHDKYHGTITIGSGGTQDTLGACSINNSAAAWYNGNYAEQDYSISLDGTDDYISIADNDDLFIDSEFSLAAWVNMATSGIEQYILSDYDATASSSAYALKINSSDQVEFYWENPGGTKPTVISDTSLSPDTWYNIFATWDGSTRKIYINGELQGQDNTAQARADNGGDMTIGRAGEYDSGYFNGKIDKVKIWNYEVSTDQIIVEYNDGTVNF